MDRKILNSNLSILILFTFFLSLNACSEKSTKTMRSLGTENNDEKLEVNFIGQWMGEGNREKIVRDFVREYSFLNQEVNINLKFPEEIGYDRYVTTSTQAFMKELLLQPIPEWDVVLINDDVEGIGNFVGDPDWAKKYLVDFSEYRELANNTIPEIDLEKVKERWGGIIPGPFLEGQYWALWTNKNVTKKLGIEIKQQGMTVDEFISYLKIVDQYNKTNSDHITPFQEANDWRTAFTIAINIYLSEMKNKDDIFTDKITEKKLNAWFKTLQVLEQCAAYNMIENDWTTIAWSDIKNNLLNEQCLFYSNGSWMYNIWAQTDESKVTNCVPNEYPTFGTLPIYPAGFPIMWGVLKNSPNKEQAIKFLLAMNQPSMAELWVRNTKSPTGIKGNLADVSFGTDQFENFSYQLKTTYGSNTYKNQENSSMIFNQKFSLEPNYFMEVLTGEITANEAMKRIRSKMSKYIS